MISLMEVEFQTGLNVITGETGVGKSLLLDAVASLLGEKRSGFPIRSGCNKAVVEAEFEHIQANVLRNWLKQNDLPDDLPLIIRREFQDNGRTRIFINDTPASLNTAKDLGDLLLDLHGQHEVVTLFDRARQLSLLDAFGDHHQLLAQYKNQFQRVKSLREILANFNKKIENNNEGREVLRKQLDELLKLDPQRGEISTIEEELNRLENSERIYQWCSDICDHINEGEHSAVERLMAVEEQLPDLTYFYSTLENWKDELEKVRSSMLELNRTLQDIGREIRHDPYRVEELRERIVALKGFQKRWNWGDTDLCEVMEILRSKLKDMDNQVEQAKKISEEISIAQKDLLLVGEKLSEQRKLAAKRLEKSVQEKLSFIGMRKARFQVEFESAQTENPYADGLDRIDFQLSPDKKLPFQVLKKVASGGEMSRILLALKSSLAEADHVDTLIFDEIDQGISGRIAHLVGLQLRELARNHQIIVVTHLPQIASLGDLHLSVRSTGAGGSAEVSILNDEERIQELASLLTAEGISEGALLNASEMLESARSLKNVS